MEKPAEEPRGRRGLRGNSSQRSGETVVLALGSNLGDRLRHLREALQWLEPQVSIADVSALYETDPVGVTDQPTFYNVACEGRTELEPEELLDFVKRLEWDAGRTSGPVWGPRPLDIDILLYGEREIDSARLIVPHERIAERAFVLFPLADLGPSRVIPGLGPCVEDLLKAVDRSGVRLIAGQGWEKPESDSA